MEDFIARCKRFIMPPPKPPRPRDMARIIEHVDAQIGRAVTRLSDR